MLASSPHRELRFAGACVVRGLRPLADQLLVRMELEEPVAGTTLLVPREAPSPRDLRRGVVVAAGPGRRTPAGGRAPMAAGIGDIVLVPAGAGRGLRLRLNGREHILVSERDVLAVVDEPLESVSGGTLQEERPR